MKAKARKSKAKFAKIEAKPLTEQQIKDFVAHYNKHKSFPGSKIPCNITGKLTTCVGPWMTKKIKEFGGAEKLLRGYQCRGALKAKKQAGKPVKAKSKRKAKITELNLKDENKNWDIPKMGIMVPTLLTREEFREATQTTCFRPDIFLNNDRHCDGCSLYEVCSSSNKSLLGAKKLKRRVA